MTAGRLRERVMFQMRDTGDDGEGNIVTNAWVDQFSVAARLVPLRGGEAVMEGRLAGRQAFVLSVRQSARTRRIKPSWRAFDERAGLGNDGQPLRVLDIKGPPTDPDGKGAWLDMLVELVVRN